MTAAFRAGGIRGAGARKASQVAHVNGEFMLTTGRVNYALTSCWLPPVGHRIRAASRWTRRGHCPVMRKGPSLSTKACARQPEHLRGRRRCTDQPQFVYVAARRHPCRDQHDRRRRGPQSDRDAGGGVRRPASRHRGLQRGGSAPRWHRTDSRTPTSTTFRERLPTSTRGFIKAGHRKVADGSSAVQAVAPERAN